MVCLGSELGPQDGRHRRNHGTLAAATVLNNFTQCCQRQRVLRLNQLRVFRTESGCGSVGGAVASDTRGPLFESSHSQILYLHTAN